MNGNIGGIIITVAVLGIIVGVFADEYVRQVSKRRRNWHGRAIMQGRFTDPAWDDRPNLVDRLRWYTLR